MSSEHLTGALICFAAGTLFAAFFVAGHVKGETVGRILFSVEIEKEQSPLLFWMAQAVTLIISVAGFIGGFWELLRP